MESVLGDANLVHAVMESIADPDADVAASMVTNWCAVSRGVREACADDARVWKALMDTHFHKWLAANAGALAMCIAVDGQHPRTYYKLLATVTRHDRQRRHGAQTSECAMPSPFNRFLCVTHKAYRASRDYAASKGVFEFPSLFVWAKEWWDALPPWERAVYDACTHVDREVRRQRRIAADIAVQKALRGEKGYRALDVLFGNTGGCSRASSV